MSKKTEEYVSQFDFENQERILDVNRMKETIRSNKEFVESVATKVPQPNEQLFNEYLGDKRKMFSFFLMRGLVWAPLRRFGLWGWIIATAVGLLVSECFLEALFCMIIALIGIFCQIKIDHAKFEKYNQQTAVFHEDSGSVYGWKCPCCKTTNDSPNHCCEKCGVLPKLVIKAENQEQIF